MTIKEASRILHRELCSKYKVGTFLVGSGDNKLIVYYGRSPMELPEVYEGFPVVSQANALPAFCG
jgi:hypothetical protein